MEQRCPSRSPAVSNSGFSDFGTPSESFPRGPPFRNPPKVIHVDADVEGEKPSMNRSLQWSGFFNIILMIAFCIVGGLLILKANEANESMKEVNGLKSELEKVKKSSDLQKNVDKSKCDDEKKKLEKTIERLRAEISHVRNDWKCCETKKINLEKEKEDLEEEKENLKKEKGNLEREKGNVEREKGNLEREHEELKKKNKDLKEENDWWNETMGKHKHRNIEAEEIDEANEKLIQELKGMLSELSEARISQTRVRTHEEQMRLFSDLRDSFRQMQPLDAQSEAPTQLPESRMESPFSPDSNYRRSFTNLRDLAPSPEPSAELSTPMPHLSFAGLFSRTFHSDASPPAGTASFPRFIHDSDLTSSVHAP